MSESILNNIIGFVTSNLTISIVFGLLVLAYVVFELFNWLSESGVTDSHVSVNKLIELLNHANAVIIDIRELDNYNVGHIISSQHIKFTDLNSEHKVIKSNLSNKKPIIIVDEQGKRSAVCVANLSKSGVSKKILYLQGGISAWRSNNMPLISNKSANSIAADKVSVYIKDDCPYCVSAKNLLESKGCAFQEIKISDVDSKEFRDMLRLSGGLKSFPQIFVGSKHIGGFNDLKALNDKGELDQLLNNL